MSEGCREAVTPFHKNLLANWQLCSANSENSVEPKTPSFDVMWKSEHRNLIFLESLQTLSFYNKGGQDGE